MSGENVGVVAAALDAFDRRDKDCFVALLDPNVEWELAGFLLDQERLRTGPEQVWDYLTFLDEEFEDIRAERGEYVEVGGQVLVPVRVRGRGRSSGIEGEFLVHVSFHSRQWEARAGTKLSDESRGPRSRGAAGVTGAVLASRRCYLPDRGLVRNRATAAGTHGKGP